MQMGFGASVVFDPLAQIQIPIMGQMLNNFAMFVFLSAGGFYKVFLTGVYRSFQSLNAYTLMTQKEHLFTMTLTGLGRLFEHALVICNAYFRNSFSYICFNRSSCKSSSADEPSHDGFSNCDSYCLCDYIFKSSLSYRPVFSNY